MQNRSSQKVVGTCPPGPRQKSTSVFYTILSFLCSAFESRRLLHMGLVRQMWTVREPCCFIYSGSVRRQQSRPVRANSLFHESTLDFFSLLDLAEVIIMSLLFQTLVATWTFWSCAAPWWFGVQNITFKHFLFIPPVTSCVLGWHMRQRPTPGAIL